MFDGLPRFAHNDLNYKSLRGSEATEIIPKTKYASLECFNNVEAFHDHFANAFSVLIA